MTEQPVGPRCGNNPNVQLTPGDRKAVDDFKGRRALKEAAKPYIDRAVWVDGDPLMEVIAATVWEHCARDDEDMPQAVCDDPRTIAAFAAAVARALPVVSATTQAEAGLRDRVVAAIKASPFEELRTVDHSPNGPLQITVKVDDLADVLLRRLPPPADRAAEEAHRLALSAALRLGTGANWEAIRDRAEDLVAEVRQLTEASRRLLEQRQEMAEERFAWQERGDRAETRVRQMEAAAPADRAAWWREAADECDTAGAAYTARALNDHAAGAFALMETFLRKANEAEHVATPCDSMVPCEDGGEPCHVHERLMAHAEGDHDLCGPECRTTDGELRRLAAEAPAAEACRSCKGSGLDPRYNGEYACPDCPAVEAPEPATQDEARRGDAFEAWLKAQRDEYEVRSSPQWAALNEVLDTYRLHADTGTPLGEHVCEGRTVGDCECLEQPAAAPAAVKPRRCPSTDIVYGRCIRPVHLDGGECFHKEQPIRIDEETDEDSLCGSEYPGDDSFVGQLCGLPKDHFDDHRCDEQLNAGYTAKLRWPASVPAGQTDEEA